MRILIDAYPDGGYIFGIECGENKVVPKPEIYKSIYDVLDTVNYLIKYLEQETGEKYYYEFTPNSTRKNRDNDQAAWKRLSDPDYRPTLPRSIKDRRE